MQMRRRHGTKNVLPAVAPENTQEPNIVGSWWIYETQGGETQVTPLSGAICRELDGPVLTSVMRSLVTSLL